MKEGMKISLLYLLIMKEAAFQPPDVDRRTGRPLKSTTPSIVSDSNNRGVSESPAIYCRGGREFSKMNWDLSIMSYMDLNNFY